jgi:hypothetical protein
MDPSNQLYLQRQQLSQALLQGRLSPVQHALAMR